MKELEGCSGRRIAPHTPPFDSYPCYYSACFAISALRDLGVYIFPRAYLEQNSTSLFTFSYSWLWSAIWRSSANGKNVGYNNRDLNSFVSEFRPGIEHLSVEQSWVLQLYTQSQLYVPRNEALQSFNLRSSQYSREESRLPKQGQVQIWEIETYLGIVRFVPQTPD